MKIKIQHIMLVLAVLLFSKSYAQDTTTTNFFNEMKSFDLSTVFVSDSIVAEDREGAKETMKRSEIIGFIGENFQRFNIHFISVIQNPTNPYEYLVYGKTMVKENICSFQGIITVKHARMYNSVEVPNVKQGFTVCEVFLYEDKNQISTGCFKGELTSKFLIDGKGQFRYDAMMFTADDFKNNQFIGTWTSYKTNASKKCNWGDYRIPECGDLDIGAGEFSVNQSYVKNGWETYKQTQNATDLNSTQARKKENEPWWKE